MRSGDLVAGIGWSRGVASLNHSATRSINTVMSTLTYEEIARLSPPERLALIGDLWDSLSDADLPVARRSGPSSNAAWRASSAIAPTA
jgi:hypothetical protein